MTAERRPAAQTITALSLYNYGLSAGVAAALGVDPALATTTVNAANSATLLPFAVRRAGVLKALEAGTSTLRWMQDWQRNMLGGVRVRAMRNLIDNGKSLPLIFPEVDLESKYSQGGVVGESCTASTHGASFTGLRLAVGARVPHFWLKPVEADNSLTVSSVQLPALIDSLDAAAARARGEESVSTPSLLLIVDSNHTTEALSSLQQLSTSARSLIRVIYVASAASDAPITHSDLQKQFQIPHFVVGEEEKEAEVTNDQSFVKRFAPVFAGDVLPEWTQANSAERRLLEFQCATGRWEEMKEAFLRQRARGLASSSAAPCSVAVVVRPDGHVAHVVVAEDQSSTAERTRLYADAVQSVAKVLHLI